MAYSRKKFLLRAALWLVIVFALLAFAPFLRAAEPQAILRPDPLTLGMKNGETKTVAMRVEQAQDLYGLEFHLRFDPKIVRVQDADTETAGVQIEPGVWLSNAFIATNQADNKRGTIDYAVTLLNPAPALNGDGIAAMIQFKALRDGDSPLQIENAMLATRDAQKIKSQAHDGTIGVSASGQAPQVQANRDANKKDNARETSPQTSALPTNLLLLGAAGIGALAFVGALGLLLIVVLMRGRSRSI
jgi:hypothetical protein